MNIFQRIRQIITREVPNETDGGKGKEVRNELIKERVKAMFLAARDFRKFRSHERKMKRIATAKGSRATSTPKRGKRWAGVRPFRELEMVKVKEGKKSVVRRMLVARDLSDSAKRFNQ